MGRIDTLVTELTTDPLTRGYDAMTNAEVAASLNTVNLTRTRTSIDTQDIADAFAAADAPAIQANPELVALVLAPQTVDPAGWARDILLAVFPGGSQTRANLAALADEQISRAEQLGYSGIVREGHVEMARARMA